MPFQTDEPITIKKTFQTDEPVLVPRSTLLSRAGERAANISSPTFGEGIAAIPEKGIRTVGGAIGTLLDIPMTAMDKIGQVITPKAISDPIDRGAAALGKKIPQGIVEFLSQEKIKPTAEAIANIAGVLPIGKIASKIPLGKVGTISDKILDVASIPQKKVGDLLQSAGNRVLKSDIMKIKDATAKKAGKDVESGVARIMSDIDKYDIASPSGYRGMVKKIDSELIKQNKIAETHLKQAINEHPGAVISLDGNMAKVRSEILNGSMKDIPLDQIGRANQVIDEWVDLLKNKFGRNIDDAATLTIEEANRARQLLSAGVFKKGAPNIYNDPVKDQVKERLSMAFRDAVEQYAPRQADANRSVRDLINVKRATLEAKKRIENKDIMGLSDYLTLGIGTGSGAIGTGNGLSGILTGTAALGAKKIISGGRGAGALIQTGKALKSNPARKLGGIGVVGSGLGLADYLLEDN